MSWCICPLKVEITYNYVFCSFFRTSPGYGYESDSNDSDCEEAAEEEEEEDDVDEEGSEDDEDDDDGAVVHGDDDEDD